MFFYSCMWSIAGRLLVVLLVILFLVMLISTPVDYGYYRKVAGRFAGQKSGPLEIRNAGADLTFGHVQFFRCRNSPENELAWLQDHCLVSHVGLERLVGGLQEAPTHEHEVLVLLDEPAVQDHPVEPDISSVHNCALPPLPFMDYFRAVGPLVPRSQRNFNTGIVFCEAG